MKSGVERSLRPIDASIGLAVLAIASVLLGSAVVSAHGEESNTEGSGAEAERAFAVPAPGTYALPPLGPATDGDVLTTTGESVRLHGLFGDEVVLLSFIYTKCSESEGCPLATAVLHRVGSRLSKEPELANRLRMISLSFDPAHDTPDVMARYGESLRREHLDWQFVTTASEATLAPLLEAYRQTRVEEVDESGRKTGQYSHLLRVFLIDDQRRIRQVYSTSLLDTEALVADVKTLLLETDRSSGVARTSGSSTKANAFGSGDVRDGYERPDFTTRSEPLASRQGRATDLVSRARTGQLGLPPLPVPEDNPLTEEKVALGRRLFFDRRLSANDTISCAMCHVPEQGFTSNELATPVGIEGRSVRRNAPTLYNVAYVEQLFHDGRAQTLEEQIWGPLLASNEMGNRSRDEVVEKLNSLGEYPPLFERAFPGKGLSEETLEKALASYQRTLVSGDSPFDRMLFGGEESALSDSARRGFELFVGKGGCVGCHTVGERDALLSDGMFHDTGVGRRTIAASAHDTSTPGRDTLRVQVAPGEYLEVSRKIVAQVSERPASDLGRYEVTGKPEDRFEYRTPSLRNVALTAPYMHDGSLATLEEVVAFYDAGSDQDEGLDPAIRPLGLSTSERSDLLMFLESLTGSDAPALVMDAFAAPVGDSGT